MTDETRTDRTLDIRGEVCPLTLVRSVLALEKLALGEVLEIVTDHEPAVANLPRTLAREGQAILRVERSGAGQWRILVRKERERGR